jgi:NAD(P)-dependent dehydrogenase (short-subunit alcohol dehydrogenase family)
MGRRPYAVAVPPLPGKTAIVTGSTGGIGFAIARGLADCGATVVVNGLTQAAVDRAVATVKASAGWRARGRRRPRRQRRVCSLVSAEPTCDILVNNVVVGDAKCSPRPIRGDGTSGRDGPALRAFASVFAPFVYKAMIQAASVRAALAATEGQPEA